MPAWTPLSKRAFPKNLSISFWVIGFPKDEIGRIFLIIFICYPFGSTCFKVIEMKMREASIRGKFSNRIIDAAISSKISYSFFDELIDQFDHRRNVGGSFWISFSLFDTQNGNIFKKGFFIKLCKLL